MVKEFCFKIAYISNAYVYTCIVSITGYFQCMSPFCHNFGLILMDSWFFMSKILVLYFSLRVVSFFVMQ